jgi:hypothetical protein
MSKTIARPRKASTPRGSQPSKRPINATALQDLWAWLLPSVWLSGITLHGNTQWTPPQLVIQAFCWTWAASRNLTEAFVEACEKCHDLRQEPALTTYQGFMAALIKWSPTLIGNVLIAIHCRMAALGSRFWRVGSWVVIAFDGSRSSAPRTKSNERAFCAANYGKGKTAKYRKKQTKAMRRKNNAKNKPQPPKPQIWITLLWHVGMRLPWVWRLGPSNSSERDHVMDMMATESFPDRTLFCGDAGFVGYPLWARILERGHNFLVRAGANVHLLVEGVNGRLVKYGRDQLVLCWPKEAQNKGLPPLRLRLIHTRINKTKVWILTSVLDPNDLTLAQAVKIYEMRWGVEVEFRGLKQTLERGNLRCHNDKRALVELNWSILAMAVAELWALKAQLDKLATRRKTKGESPPESASEEYSPLKRSLAETMRALRWCFRNARKTSVPGEGLVDRLAAAMTDDYQRTASKCARYRPPNPDKKPLGEPKLRRLTPAEMQKLKELKLKMIA